MNILNKNDIVIFYYGMILCVVYKEFFKFFNFVKEDFYFLVFI